MRDSRTAAAILFGTKGKVISRRGVLSGVMTSRLRQMGQSTDSCQPPQACEMDVKRARGRGEELQTLCKREKNHLRIQMAQKVCPH